MPRVTPSQIVKAAITTIHDVQLEIERQLQSNPLAALTRLPMEKPLLVIDMLAERIAETGLRRLLRLTDTDLHYLGEEQLGIMRAKEINLADEERLVVLVDMVDGTDLLERGLSNWCSAMIVFDPQAEKGRKILAAFVGIPEDGVYYATRESADAWKHRFHVQSGKPRLKQLPKLSSRSGTLAEASICFYGQQTDNIADMVGRGLIAHLEELSVTAAPNKLRTRIYNLAGMPMMMKMLDSGDGLTRMDAVFDVYGQQPHDMVAGAYIAQAAGAVLSDLDGKPLDLEDRLLRPASEKLHYVLAATDSLALELRGCLKKLSLTKAAKKSRAEHR
jgi:fructose-1,6-bisphosphatase/inositol monophosphatase family enzyme